VIQVAESWVGRCDVKKLIRFTLLNGDNNNNNNNKVAAKLI
jgi:hypothetical protein